MRNPGQINLPFGILALLGILAFVPETERSRARGFDFFGFALLSRAIETLQAMLDRGESQDWFTSTAIVVEAVLAGEFLYLFLLHMVTAERPFLEPRLFKDRNFAVGLLLIFMVGVVLLATLALLPPFLQNLMGVPVLTTGYVLAPRGIDTMIAMVMVGRLIGRTDTRLLILAPHYRNEGTAIFSLMRNIGSSIGISAVITLLARNTQVNHADLASNASPFRAMLQLPWLPSAWNWHSTAGVVALNNEITRQAATVAYLNDFIFMMWMTLAAMPLLLRKPGRRRAAQGLRPPVSLRIPALRCAAAGTQRPQCGRSPCRVTRRTWRRWPS